MSFHVPEQHRIHAGELGSDARYGNYGAFLLPRTRRSRRLAIIASEGLGWEHVSVHATDGAGHQWTPSWDEMCHAKNVFWDGEDVVIQYHPRQSEYRNLHVNTLHLWRPVGIDVPTPPPMLVGPVGVQVAS